jgi:cation:H+ antiporter
MLTWIFVAVAGFGIALLASRTAVQQAAKLAYGFSIPPFIIGVSFFAFGTDVPEIANSVMASLAGHGDLNVGDSVGSVVTQITLIFGLLPFLGGKFEVGRYRASIISLLTIVALALGAWLVADGYLSRLDGVFLLVIWIATTSIAWRYAPAESEPVMVGPGGRLAFHATMVILSLLLVAAGAGSAVKALTELSSAFGVPEYLISFFGSSIGTSLPELLVDVTALRQGQRDLAFGDITGSCLVDASLSIGAGPLIAPTAVTAALALRGAGVAMIVMFVASFIIWLRRKHDRLSGSLLLLLYVAVYVAMIKMR